MTESDLSHNSHRLEVFLLLFFFFGINKPSVLKGMPSKILPYTFIMLGSSFELVSVLLQECCSTENNGK